MSVAAAIVFGFGVFALVALGIFFAALNDSMHKRDMAALDELYGPKTKKEEL